MLPATVLRRLLRTSTPTPSLTSLCTTRSSAQGINTFSCALRPSFILSHSFSSTPKIHATYNQVIRGSRKPQPARKRTSPQLKNRPQIQGVCVRVTVTKPKKPNSGERKTCRVRLSTGREVWAYIPGEGHNIQQHSVVLLQGGRAQDCPGVRYTCVRGAGDLGGVPNRVTSRSKYGTKKPKKTE